MRIALVISNLEYGGTQRQLIELVNSSTNLDVEYYIICLSPTVPLASQLTIANRVRIVTKHFRFDVSVVPRLARLLRELEIDIAHGFLFDAEIAVRIAGFLARTPIVLGSERNTDYRIKPIQRLAYMVTHNLREACIANSTAGAKYNAAQLGYPIEHYRVVHNGVDTRRFRPIDKSVACQKLGLDETYKWVGMIGSFKRQKNHKIFFQAAKKLIEKFPDVHILLAGDTLAEGMHHTDAYKKEVIDEIMRLDLENRIVFLGNREDIEIVYSACEVTALPSFHEGTPNVALESMACGIPVVASDVSDNRYIIPDGTAGFVVPVNDVDSMYEAMQRILFDNNGQDFRGQARRWVEKEFSSAAFAQKMLGVYESFIE